MNPCLFNNPGVKNIFQYLLLHLTSFSYLHIRETCIHPPCTNTHYQRLPPKDVDFNHSEWSPTCHSLFFFFFFQRLCIYHFQELFTLNLAYLTANQENSWWWWFQVLASLQEHCQVSDCQLPPHPLDEATNSPKSIPSPKKRKKKEQEFNLRSTFLNMQIIFRLYKQ